MTHLDGMAMMVGAALWAGTVRAIGVTLGVHYPCRAMRWLRAGVGILLYGISAAAMTAGAYAF